MSLREIRLLGDDVLRKPADPVEEFDDELRALVEDMWETMYHADGIGLAAPQIGISKRLIVVHARRSDERSEGEAFEPIALANPRVIESSKKTEKEIEGCLSIPGVEEYVTRPADVRIEAQDTMGEPVELSADGLLGRALQHEIDHLDGVLFIDRVSPLKRRLLMKRWEKSQADE